MTQQDVGDPALAREETKAALAFVRLMGRKMALNRHKGGWKRVSPRELLMRLKEEVAELEIEVEHWERTRKLAIEDRRISTTFGVDALGHVSWEIDLLRLSARVVDEAVDVANFACFLADVVGGLNE